HARDLLLDVLRAIGQLRCDPADVEEDAAVRAAAARFHLAHDAAAHVIARQQLGRPAGRLVALRVAPALFLVVGGLAFVVRGNVVEHETAAFPVPGDAALAAHAFGGEEGAHAPPPRQARPGAMG